VGANTVVVDRSTAPPAGGLFNGQSAAAGEASESEPAKASA